MNTHQNARLTVWGRAEAVRRLLVDGEPIAVVAAALHVSPRTLTKWRQRFLLEGPAGLLDRSSRPHRSPGRTAGPVVRRIVHLRTTQRLTGPEIAARLQLPVATVGRLLQRVGLFPAFLDFYNTARDHSALGHVPPLLHFLSRTPGPTS